MACKQLSCMLGINLCSVASVLTTDCTAVVLQLPTVDEVEFWKNPEKSGWLYSQGDVIKTWRRRWFVLKQGFLFRFAESDVKPASKPRGIVDLSLVTNVVDGREATGKPNSLKLSTATGGQVRAQALHLIHIAAVKGHAVVTRLLTTAKLH